MSFPFLFYKSTPQKKEGKCTAAAQTFYALHIVPLLNSFCFIYLYMLTFLAVNMVDVASKIADIRNRASQLGLQVHEDPTAGHDALSVKVIGRFGGDGDSSSRQWQSRSEARSSSSWRQSKIAVAGESGQLEARRAGMGLGQNGQVEQSGQVVQVDLSGQVSPVAG